MNTVEVVQLRSRSASVAITCVLNPLACCIQLVNAQGICPLAVAVSQGAVKELLACCREALCQDASSQPLAPDLAKPAAQALTAVLASDSARDEFAEQDGSTALTAVLKASEGVAPVLLWPSCSKRPCSWSLR